MITSDFLANFFKNTPSVQQYIVAYSGGVDSHVLLKAMADYAQRHSIKLTALHVNHGLSPHSNQWQQHCESVCQQLGVPLHVEKIHETITSGIETGARHARYQIFERYLNQATALLLAHHQEDQAETVLFRLLRGTGVAGLSGIPKIRQHGAGMIMRPLLDLPKKALEDYASEKAIQWVEDESNQSLGFSRNFLRHKIFPELKKRWPSVSAQFSKTAKLCEDAHCLLEDLADIDYRTMIIDDDVLCLLTLSKLNQNRQVNVLRYWFKQLKLPALSHQKLTQLIQTVVDAPSDKNLVFQYHALGEVHRFNQQLYFVKKCPAISTDFNERWVVSMVFQSEILGGLSAKKVVGRGLRIQEGDVVEVRVRQGGERCKLLGDKHTRSLKYLLQTWQIPPWRRQTLPLIYINSQLAGIADLAVVEKFAAGADERGYVIAWSAFF